MEKNEIVYLPNVVSGLIYGVKSISEPGDEIIIMTPVYGPFYKVINNTDRVLVESPMKNDNGYYTMDLEDFESKIIDKTKGVIICNPHNPVGRVWTREELKALGEICVKHNLYILSDDIHSELVTKAHQHTFISLISPEIRDRSMVFTSPTKAFNLASIHVENCFISNKELRERFVEIAEGTYLVWVDFSKTDIPRESLKEYLLKECHVAVNEGEFFGILGSGHVRFNLACPRKNTTLVLEKLSL